MWFPRISGSRS
jgi:uncharacterized protein Usg